MQDWRGLNVDYLCHADLRGAVEYGDRHGWLLAEVSPENCRGLFSLKVTPTGEGQEGSSLVGVKRK